MNKNIEGIVEQQENNDNYNSNYNDTENDEAKNDHS